MEGVIRIDLHEVVRSRLSWGKYVPHLLMRPLERLVHQDEMNLMLENLAGLTGPSFCRALLRELDFVYTLRRPELLPEGDDSRVMYISNHPLGGLDGIALIDMVARRHPGKKIRFVVNDLLQAVVPLRECFVPINKHGAQSRAASRALDDVMEGRDPVIVFPAGLVSRMDAQGEIADLEWHKMFVAKAIQSRRDIIPLYFEARNTDRFYKFARLRTRLGLKFNYEMALLPSEVFKSRGGRAVVHVGQRVPWHTLRGGPDVRAQAHELRGIVYSLRCEK